MKVIFAAALLAIAAAAPAPESPPAYKPTPAPYKPAPAPYHPAPAYNEPAKPFAYDYAVDDKYTGTQFAKNEESDGKSTKGSFSVALPDSRIQTVNYYTEDAYSGNKAEVTYEGEAQFPANKPAPAPYKPAKY